MQGMQGKQGKQGKQGMQGMQLTRGMELNTELLCVEMHAKSFLKFESLWGARLGAVRHWCTFLFPPTGTDS